MRIDTPPFQQRTVYAHDVSHREGVCVWPALPVRYVLCSYGVSHRQVGCVCGMQEGDALARYMDTLDMYGVSAYLTGRGVTPTLGMHMAQLTGRSVCL